jgi:hypothetical protein
MATKTKDAPDLLTGDTVNNQAQQDAADQARDALPNDLAEDLGLGLPSPANDDAAILAHVRDAIAAEAASAVGDAQRSVGIETASKRKADQGYNLDAEIENPPNVGDAYRPLAVEGEDPPRMPKGAPPLSPVPPGAPDPSIYGDKPRSLEHQETHGGSYARRIQVEKRTKGARLNKNSMLASIERERRSLDERMLNTAEVRILAPPRSASTI